ncbi:MAG: class B sortase [Oscillibacter sp.]|nr:class B sortase [Oscillibacter sp.]
MKVSLLSLAQGGVSAVAKGVALTAAKGTALAVGNSLLTLTSGVLAASMISYSSFVIYDTAYTQNQARSASAELLSYKPTVIDSEDVPLSGSTLALINDDYRAWLTIQDTAIDYPVVQGENDLYYASHDIYKNASLTGAIYVASANSPDFGDSYNLIYGHHMDQNIMFGALDKYLDESYLYAHRSGVLATDARMYDLNMFAVVETDAYEQAFYRAGDRMDEVIAFLRNPGSTTTVAFFDEGALSDVSQIVAFSTCASATTNGRLIVLATMKARLQYESSGSYSTSSRSSGTPDGTPPIPGELISEVTPGTPGGTDSGTPDGGTPGGTDSGTPDGGTPGGTDSGTPGGGTPGSTDSGTPDGGTPGGTDSGTPDGGTPGGTDSGTPDGGTPGGTDSGTPGGGTPGGTDSGTPGGGTPGGTDSGTPGGGTPGGTDSGTPGGGTPGGTDSGIPGGGTPGGTDSGTPETPLELTEIDDDATPLARFTNRFQPRGISYGGRAWALLNLIALFCTAYLLLPLLHVRAKYGRAGTMKKINRLKAELRTASNLDDVELTERLVIHREAAEEKARGERRDIETAVQEAEARNFEEITQDDFSKAVETLYYHVKKYIHRFRLGIVLEVGIVALAGYVFVHTENIRLPMVLIDKWTPLMLLFLALCWVTDISLEQYRDKLSFSVKEADGATDSVTDAGLSQLDKGV